MIPLVLHILYTFTCVWITHNSLGLAFSLHFHPCFELPIIHSCCVFSTLSPVFWITHTTPLVLRILYTFTCFWNPPGVAYSLHLHPSFELPIIPLVSVFSTISHAWRITHNSLSVVYSSHFYLFFELPMIPLPCIFSTLHVSELPIIPLVLRFLYTFTCVLNTHNPRLLRILYTFTCVMNYP